MDIFAHRSGIVPSRESRFDSATSVLKAFTLEPAHDFRTAQTSILYLDLPYPVVLTASDDSAIHVRFNVGALPISAVKARKDCLVIGTQYPCSDTLETDGPLAAIAIPKKTRVFATVSGPYSRFFSTVPLRRVALDLTHGARAKDIVAHTLIATAAGGACLENAVFACARLRLAPRSGKDAETTRITAHGPLCHLTVCTYGPGAITVSEIEPCCGREPLRRGMSNASATVNLIPFNYLAAAQA